MQVARVERVWWAVGFVDGEAVEQAIKILHVGDVAAKANDGGVGECAEALDVCEAGEGAVGC